MVFLMAGYKWWTRHHVEGLANTNAPEALPDSGFVRMPQPVGTSTGEVLIFAPLHCSSDAAARAEALSQELASKGIPHVRLNTARFDMERPDQQMMKRLKQVMEGTVPIVFVHGRAKANPTLDEVVAEYGASRR